MATMAKPVVSKIILEMTSVKPRVGVVIVAGRSPKTVTVQCPTMVYNKEVRKQIEKNDRVLAHDEYEACVEGDVVQVQPGCRNSSAKRHLVTRIISPYNTGEERREPESLQEYFERRAADRERLMLRRLETNPAKYLVKYEKIIAKDAEPVSERVMEIVVRGMEEIKAEAKRVKEEKIAKAQTEEGEKSAWERWKATWSGV